MPSGITQDIYDGSDTSLRGYLMRVGRGMGYAILQRDDDSNAPVKLPGEDYVTKHHREALAEAQDELERLKAMPLSEAAAEAVAAFVERKREVEKSKAETEELRARYKKMIEQVTAWKPDPLVASTKDYALKQLHQSLELDCGKPDESNFRYREPQRLSPEEWLDQAIKNAERDIKYHHEQYLAAVQRDSERRMHIEAFLRSLPDV